MPHGLCVTEQLAAEALAADANQPSIWVIEKLVRDEGLEEVAVIGVYLDRNAANLEVFNNAEMAALAQSNPTEFECLIDEYGGAFLRVDQSDVSTSYMKDVSLHVRKVAVRTARASEQEVEAARRKLAIYNTHEQEYEVEMEEHSVSSDSECCEQRDSLID